MLGTGCRRAERPSLRSAQPRGPGLANPTLGKQLTPPRLVYPQHFLELRLTEPWETRQD